MNLLGRTWTRLAGAARPAADSDLRRQLAAAIETVSDGFALLDRDERFVLINANFHRIYRSVGEVLRPGVRYDAFARRLAVVEGIPEAAGRLEPFVAERMALLRAPGAPFEHRMADGRWIRVADYRGEDGGIVCVRTDITELKQREQLLREGEERFRRLSEITFEAVLILENGVIVDHNRALVELSGYAPSELVGMSTLDLLAPEFRALARERIVARDERPYEAIGQRKDGTRLPVELHFRHVQHDGRTFRVVAVRDIRERRQAEQALQASEARTRAIVEAALDAIVTMDSSGVIVEFNAAAERIFGFARAAVIGRTVGETIVPPEQRERHREGLARYLATGERQLIGGRIELEALRADGTRFPSELTMTELALGDRNLFTAFIRDLTDVKRFEQEMAVQRERLHQSEKLSALGSLLAGVAHELNNPLAVVVAQATLLQETAPDESVAARGERIRRAAERCAKIVRSFLAMARQRQPQRGVVHMNAAIADALELVGYSLRTAGIEVAQDVPGDLPPLWVDPDQLNQVLTNLMVNAQQAMTEVAGPRRLTLVARQASGGALAIEVGDTGPGVPAEIRARIFEPFFTTKPLGVGTGVGLSVCHAILESNGGSIAVGDAPGGGARFTVLLPVAPPDAGAAKPPADAAPRSPTSRRLLVVDDEPEIAATLAEILEREGHAVDVAESGEAAWQQLVARRYDLILSDLRMPGLDGPALYRRLSTERPAMAARVVIVTGDTLNAAGREFLRQTALPCLEKPFVPDDVRRIVAAALATG